ncbi:hypothetical protein Taro_009175 [Colocasia esculenta]|uniref:Uncharacterized protein n=1 Tax=Colocasia esculenta TaxID=4460 RepID=A0A843U3B5_COLES|nr:hypothetical protein [Colocasia esculenta]
MELDAAASTACGVELPVIPKLGAQLLWARVLGLGHGAEAVLPEGVVTSNGQPKAELHREPMTSLSLSLPGEEDAASGDVSERKLGRARNEPLLAAYAGPSRSPRTLLRMLSSQTG